MVKVAGVRFRGSGKIYWFDPGELEVRPGAHVIVETARGSEYGVVSGSLRELPDTTAYRLAKVPLGSLVTDCYYVNDRFACVTWNGYVGYILVDNLGWD